MIKSGDNSIIVVFVGINNLFCMFNNLLKGKYYGSNFRSNGYQNS